MAMKTSCYRAALAPEGTVRTASRVQCFKNAPIAREFAAVPAPPSVEKSRCRGRMSTRSPFALAGTARRSVKVQAVVTAESALDVAKVRSRPLGLEQHPSTAGPLTLTPWSHTPSLLCPILQMAPLGDRLLVKPKEKEEVRRLQETCNAQRTTTSPPLF